MTRILMLLVTAAAVTAALSGVAQQQEKTLAIDGAKNPEKFPEWYVWEQAFLWIGSEPPASRSGKLHDQLGVSEEELVVVQGEMKAFRQSREILKEELKKSRGALTAQGKKEDEIREASQQLNIAYRNTVLDARKRIYEQLSPISVLALRSWINKRLAGTKLFLSGRTLEYFHLPW